MSINPGSDILLDVVKAADPARAQSVTQRLDALASEPAGNPTAFAAALDAAGPAPAPPSSPMSDLRQRLPGIKGVAADRDEKAKQAFAASILTQFVQEMLPKNNSAVFGQGTSGDVWRSMLAEQVANQLAHSGQIGLAKKLFATHDALENRPRAGDLGAARAAQYSANPLSMPANLELTNDSLLFKTKAST